MATKIKTGLVYQRTLKGPNYLCLGKANVGGEMRIISVKNGNIRKDGNCKLAGKETVNLYAHKTDSVARIHQVREVNVASVFSRGEAMPAMKALVKRMLKKGIATGASVPVVGDLV